MATGTQQDLPAALLGPIRNGTYPDSEEVIVSELVPSDLSATLKLLTQSREELQAEIRQTSSRASTDVDKWITQAQQLQADIEKSRKDARDIVQKHEAGKALSIRVEDASAKVRLLYDETEYNDAVIGLLRDIQCIMKEVSSIRTLLESSDLKVASDRIFDLQASLYNRRDTSSQERAWSLVLAQVDGLRSRALQDLQSTFDELVDLNEANESTLMIYSDRTGTSNMDLKAVLEALQKLGAMDGALNKLSNILNRSLLQPLVSHESPSSLQMLDTGGLKLQRTDSRTLSQVIDDLQKGLEYLRTTFPPNEATVLASKCLHNLIPSLIGDWLSASIPLSLTEMHDFKDEQTKVSDFVTFLSTRGWDGADHLSKWLERFPRMWLTKRRGEALDGIRTIFLSYAGATKSVERVERETVTRKDNALGNNTGWDDWDAGWSQEQEEQNKSDARKFNHEEEDVSGWDFEAAEENSSQTREASNDEPETADAWGWDDEDDKPPDSKQLLSPSKPNGSNAAKGISEREMTLKETYTVTSVPDSIMEIISRQLSDAETLTGPDFEYLRGASPFAGLRALPALILAMFRATASSFYGATLAAGNMQLYNDCLYLGERFKAIAEDADLARYEDDVVTLDKFGKGAYAREMDTQRTVLGDLLDGAQGFASCTEYPFSAECETAIGSTVDRLQTVHEEWKTILSHSALLQSTGSLLATIIDKIIKDIEDMEDISEAESQRLASFCSQISKLDSLFMPEGQDLTGSGDGPVPMTAVYVSNWLRFQYLANILDSSLVDIKYLWIEGELSLEFTADEVTDLIRALFADSHHRRNAIAEIRRSATS